MVSIDQLESPVPGFIPIAKGQPTTSHYRGATIFVDHASDFSYVHLNQALTTQETLDAKHAFECIAKQHSVHICHYHCDNGSFADWAFMDDVRQAHQTITFCGVGAHHQNGIAKQRIHDLMESTRTMLLHAAHRWPKAITSNLWPQALKHATNVQNSLPHPGKTQSPISLFTNMIVEPNIKHSHLFGCPVYVLQAPLQNNGPFAKWSECSQVGIFLYHSPHHAASILLILSTQMGLVSPQFHCVYDDAFDTVKAEMGDTSVWQCKAHLTKTTENVNNDATNDILVTAPTRQTMSMLPQYPHEVPAALLCLPELAPPPSQAQSYHLNPKVSLKLHLHSRPLNTL